MTTVYFLQHGARESGPGDTNLSPLGRQQVRALARRLARKPIAALYCSPRLATWETAVALSTTHRLPILFDARLRDRASWDDAMPHTLANYLAIWQHCNRHRDHVQPGGVSSRQAGVRLEHLVQDLHNEHPGQAVIAVSHATALMDFLRNVFSLSVLAHHNPAVTRDPYSSGVLPEASLTVLQYDGRHFRLQRLGDADHLARLFQRPAQPHTYTAPRLAPALAA
jgi:broad specificity phosphatase PhoE